MLPALCVMHWAAQGRARERTHAHTHTRHHTFTLLPLVHTPVHTCLHVCAEAEQCLVCDLHFSLLSHTPSSQTQPNCTGLQPGTSGDSWLISSDPAFTVKLGALPAPPSPSTSLHSFIPHSPSCEAACVAEGHRAALCRGVAQCQESWSACSSVRD